MHMIHTSLQNDAHNGPIRGCPKVCHAEFGIFNLFLLSSRKAMRVQFRIELYAADLNFETPGTGEHNVPQCNTTDTIFWLSDDLLSSTVCVLRES